MPVGILATDGATSASSTAGSSTASYTIPRTLFSRIMAAIRQKLILRPLAAMIVGPSGVPGSSVDFALQEPDTIEVSTVGEGAEIPYNTEDYSGFNIKPIKYGVRIPLTKEVMEDSNFGLMELNIQSAVHELALNEESLIVTQLSAASTAASHDVSNSNATLPISDITSAMQKLEVANYTPTHMLVGAEVANDLRNIDTFVEADKAGINDPSKRLIGTIFGMKVMVSNSITATEAFVMDRNFAFIGVEKRPVTVTRYNDESREVSFAVVTQRIAYRYLRAKAVSNIVTT